MDARKNAQLFTHSVRAVTNDLPSSPGPLLSKLLQNIFHQLSLAVRASKGTFVYPIRGIVYSVHHPGIYNSVLSSLSFGLLSAIAIFVGLAVFTYVPQSIFFSLFLGPYGFLAAIGTVLVESFILVNLVSRALFIEPSLDAVFDAVIAREKAENLIQKVRATSSYNTRLHSAQTHATQALQIFSFGSLFQYLITLPVNFFPVLGNIAFLYLNGSKTAESFHRRYFSLLGLSGSQRSKFVDERRGAYISFGITALILDLVPLVSILFMFTNTVGAALWAVSMEKEALKKGQK